VSAYEKQSRSLKDNKSIIVVDDNVPAPTSDNSADKAPPLRLLKPRKDSDFSVFSRPKECTEIVLKNVTE